MHTFSEKIHRLISTRASESSTSFTSYQATTLKVSSERLETILSKLFSHEEIQMLNSWKDVSTKFPKLESINIPKYLTIDQGI